MKKIAIIAITLFLLLSVVNFGTSEPMMEYNSNPNPDNSSENSVIDNVQEQQIIQNMNRLDGFFTENKGQVGNDSVRYYIQGKGVWFLDDGVVYEIRGPPEPAVLQRERFDRSHPEFEPVMSAPRKSVVLRLNFEGCNKIEPKGVGMLPHQSNYFFGNDSSKWCINVPNFQEIVYENIYDDIDLRYYSNDKGLKYDFKVHPGGNPEDIKIKCEGVQDLLLNTPFELIFHTPLGDIIDTGLFIYQDFPKQCNAVHGKFKLVNSKTFGFEIFGNYDKTKTLIIDPVVFSSFVGGSNVETGAKIATDSNLNIYVTGSTNSNNFPNTTGANDTTYNNGYDIFVFKMNPSGSSLVYSTFIGGTADDLGYDIALDLSKNVYVTGRTKSSDFPFTSGANDTSYNGGTIGDAIVFKLNQSGSKLSYSTFIGSGADDEGNGITVDINGNAYITGYTTSNTFPTTPGSWNESNSGSADAFILKLDASGSTIVFSTYIGGSEGDKGWGIAINSNNDVFITGHTVSSDFPITPGAYDDSHNTWTDIFISKLNKTGSTLMYSTFIGGNKEDSGDEIIIDDLENVYVTGTTWSDDFPTSITAYDDSYNQGYDCYVLKLNLTNSMLLYSTYIGGGDYDEGNGLALDASNNIYLTGYTFSQDFPNTTNALDTSHNGASDIFLLKLNQTGSSLVYSTYLGGSNHDRGQSVAIDILGDLCLTGNTESNNFPNTTNSFDPIHNGNRDAFVFKFRLNTLPLVLDIQKSENEIFRADTISIFSNGSDNEDIEKNLRPHFEYRDPNEQVWNNTCFTMLQYQDSRWEVGFTPPINATLGLYDFRVRLNDTFNQFSTWFYLNDSLLVLNNIPKTEEITLSNNSALLDDNMLIWINSTDIEETEENLTTELEYRDPNEVLWNKTYLSSPTYNNGKWEYSFNIPFDALFGYYDLRARVNDSDGNYSTWIYLNDSLRIYNTGPKVIDAGLSEISIYRTEPVFLYINGTDHETPEDIISFYIQYKPQNEGDWTNLTGNYLNYTWEVCFTTYIDSILGSYDFRVKFEDNESISSGWKYVNDSLEVLNNLPMISDTLDDISVGIQPLILDLTQYESDIEDTDLNLTWSISPQIFSYI